MMTLKKNISILPYNTFAVDVQADYLVEYDSADELIAFLNSDIAKNNRLLPIGSGSNLLFLSDFKGVILHSAINVLDIVNENDEYIYLKVGSGVIWDDFAAYCVSKNWSGAENLSHIPGTVGASAVQNIGAYGVEAKDIIHEVETVEIATLEQRTFSTDECHYAYRDSIFKKEYSGKYIVTAVVFRLSKKPVFQLNYQHLEAEVTKRGEINLQDIRQTIIDIRSEKLPDPAITGNAGSFFMNPVVSTEHFLSIQKDYPQMPYYTISETETKIPAAWLIDQCGWKGKQIENVGVHQHQALVLINLGSASGKEVADVAKNIQTSVKNKFDIDLQPEVNFI